MEQGENKMNSDFPEQDEIKPYLLGNLSDETKMRQIEEKLLLNDEFAERLAMAEEDLIDEYLDGNLTDAESEKFQSFFLITNERRQKFRFLENLRKFAAAKTVAIEPKPEEKTSFWTLFFSSFALRFAVGLLIVGAVGFGIWRLAFYQSDVDRGLTELELAYRGRRPLEARTTLQKEYAPFTVTRGNEQVQADENAKRTAELSLLNAAKDSNSAKAHHALGLFYLADKQFEKALAEFKLAEKLDSDWAVLQSDLGAVLLELGKNAKFEKKEAESFEFINESLKHLDKAVALAPKMLEARFNRALCLQFRPTSEQTKQAWREYLELDPNSKWADEARRYLENLETQKSQDISADELEQLFINASSEKDETRAHELLSRHRELIREKYLPQRLAMSYLKAADTEKKTFLGALKFAGELEKKHIKDPFAAELAQFYENLPAAKIESLGVAQESVGNGYKLLLDNKYKDALSEFEKAQEVFRQNGDIWEAQLSEYFIAYTLINSEQTVSALEKLNELVKFSRAKNYRWLEMTALHWVGGGYVKLGRPTDAKQAFEQALTLAEDLQDSYAMQRNLIEAAKINAFVGQKTIALQYLDRALTETNRPETSLRQRYRVFGDAFAILTKTRFFDSARPFALESVRLADALDDRMFKVFSRNNVALTLTESGRFSEAQEWLDEGRRFAELIPDEKNRRKMIAYSLLFAGHIARRMANFDDSIRFYGEAGEIYQTLEMPANYYESQKGQLLGLLALGKSEDLEKQIPVVIKQTEDYREKILDEQEKTLFFDREQSVYDIAVDFEFRRGQFEKSFEFAESANSRALLDWLKKGVKNAESRERFEGLLKESAVPLDLSEIRAKMPPETQILQYCVLEDKVLIWLVAKEKFTAKFVTVKSSDLRETVENYLKAVQNPNENPATIGLGQKLYEILIAPIKGELDPQKSVCLIPNKILFFLPFAALSGQDGQPFIKNFEHFYAPGASVFIHNTESAASKAGKTSENILAAGNPAFEPKKFIGLADLPNAEREVSELSKFYPSAKVLIGREAVKQSVQDALKTADVIHFAGHYVVVQNAPLASYLLLADDAGETEKSILTNAELVGEKLPNAKLVVLSACQTGLEHYYNGEGPIGLSRTFLAAGAPLVVASHWQVETEATARLMNRFHYFRRQENLPTSAALRKAQIEMLNDPQGRFKTPFYWAAFAVFGGFAKF